jgi:lambda family phage minor tail protein L
MSLASVVQTPDPGPRVSLFRLDATSVGGSVMFFCQGAFDSTGPTFGGVYYTPVDVELTGFEITGGGALPTPKIKIANTSGVFQALVNTYGDLVGCQIQRVRTFERFLDGQPEADPTAYFGPDTFKIDRKTDENPVYIEWDLAASIDVESKALPGRIVIRDTCTWRYRVWNANTNSFDYTNVQCPYTGGASFDITGASVSSDKDECGRKLSDCRLRFGQNAVLPFGGFPGAARVHG